MAISKLGVIQPLVSFCRGRNVDHFLFLWHNFGSRYAGKPIKGSKDSDNSLVSTKNLNETIGSLDWHPGPRKLGQKNENDTPTCDVLPQRNINPKQKIFFFNFNQQTCWIRRWFQHLSSSIGWRVV